MQSAPNVALGGTEKENTIQFLPTWDSQPGKEHKVQ